MKTRKKSISVFTVYVSFLSLLALFIFCNSGTGVVHAKQTTLNFANFEPPVGFASPSQQAFADEIEKRSGGRYKVDIAWGGAMGKIEDHYDLVRNGIADISYFLSPLTPGMFPMSDIISLPWILPNADVSVKAMWKLYKAGYLDKEYSKVKPIFVWAGPGQQIFSSEPIETLAGIKGKKLISHSEINNEIISKAMGAVPVFIPHGEMYGAIQKGIVDGALFVWVGIQPFNLQEVVHYCVDLSFGNITCVIAMNMNSYDKLQEEDRNIINKAAEDTLFPLMIKGYDDTTVASKDVFKKSGGKTSVWTKTDIDKMNSELSPLWNNWIKEKEDQGLPAKEAVNFLWKTLKELGVDEPAIGYRPDK